MIGNLESELIALIKASPLGKKVKEVDSLPALDGANLVQKFNTAAPAIYVACDPFGINDSGLAIPKFGIACVAKNASGQKAALRGDGITMGLNDMLDAVLSIFNFANTASCGWIPRGVEFVREELLFNNGVWVGIVKLSGTEVSLPPPIDAATLAAFPDFTQFHSDLNVQPHAPAAVQAEWSQQNYQHGRPLAQDDVTL